MSQYGTGRLYINRVVQKALFCRMLWHWAFALAAVAAGLIIAHFFKTAPIRPEVSFGDRCIEALQSNALVLAMLACLIPIFMRDTLRVSRRLVEPLEPIKAAMDNLARGIAPEPIGPAKAKCWDEFAEAINQTAERIQLLEAIPTTPPATATETLQHEIEEPVTV